jgi:hypothetical protein
MKVVWCHRRNVRRTYTITFRQRGSEVTFRSMFLRCHEGVMLLDKQTGKRKLVKRVWKRTEHVGDSWIQHFRKAEDKVLTP